MVNDLAVVEDRARKICAGLGVDPDEILDPYGPVRRRDVVAYHISEAIEAIRRPVPADVADRKARSIAVFSALLASLEECTADELAYIRLLPEAAALLTTLASGRDEVLPEVGAEVIYSAHGIELKAIVVGYIEGWINIQLADKSCAVVRPSHILSQGDQQ